MTRNETGRNDGSATRRARPTPGHVSTSAEAFARIMRFAPTLHDVDRLMTIATRADEHEAWSRDESADVANAALARMDALRDAVPPFLGPSHARDRGASSVSGVLVLLALVVLLGALAIALLRKQGGEVVSRRAHTPEIASSNLAPATIPRPECGSHRPARPDALEPRTPHDHPNPISLLTIVAARSGPRAGALSEPL